MRPLKRNQQTIYYKNYAGKVANAYGELTDSYGATQEARAFVSYPNTDVSRDTEGMRLDYDRVLIAENIDVNEQTAFYIDVSPDTSDYDYIAVRVMKSFNHLRVYLKRA